MGYRVTRTDQGFGFVCRKQPARGSKGVVVTNHPLASGVATQMLLEGGNAADAAVAALFALSVVEPMMVGVLGGGLSHVRTAHGEHTIIDGLGCAPAAAHACLYTPVASTAIADRRITVNRENELGARAVAVPGALAAWCALLERYGSVSLADAMEPAIRLAARGFEVTPYLATNAAEQAGALARDPALTRLFLPEGRPIRAGSTLRQPEFAATLRTIATEGPAALYNGPLGATLVDTLTRAGGLMTQDDLVSYRVRDRMPIRGRYRDHDIIGPPPPASSGIHIVQMLNMLETFDVRAAGFGSVAATHWLAEAMAIAFADRSAATADPDFVDVPIDRLTSKPYARERAAQIDLARRQRWSSGIGRTRESSDTTHLTIADSDGMVVASTHTLNGAFGAAMMIEGTGLIANNYMYNFDPHPGGALSVEPGKRVFTSMAPMMVLRDEQLKVALGLPGGLRIFPSAMQAIVNLIDHDMSLQQAVEAPRIFTEGGDLELEEALPPELGEALSNMGHPVRRVPRVAGGMNAISFDRDGMMTGAACWRADGTPVAISGGLAQAGTGFGAV
jgi:gamma-glutamyltranspeptidase/glutathione hydrolase